MHRAASIDRHRPRLSRPRPRPTIPASQCREDSAPRKLRPGDAVQSPRPDPEDAGDPDPDERVQVEAYPSRWTMSNPPDGPDAPGSRRNGRHTQLRGAATRAGRSRRRALACVMRQRSSAAHPLARDASEGFRRCGPLSARLRPGAAAAAARSPPDTVSASASRSESRFPPGLVSGPGPRQAAQTARRRVAVWP